MRGKKRAKFWLSGELNEQCLSGYKSSQRRPRQKTFAGQKIREIIKIMVGHHDKKIMEKIMKCGV